MVLKLIGGLVVATLIAVGLYQVLTYLLADREPAPTPKKEEQTDDQSKQPPT